MLPARQDLFQVFARSLQLATVARLNPAVVNIAGSDLNLVAGACSLMGEEISAALASCLEGHWSDTATASALDRLAADRYSLTRLGATPATITLTFARPTFAAGAGTIQAGTKVRTAAGAEFATDVDLAFSGTDLSKTVTATALAVGPDSNVGIGQVNAIEDSLFDSTFTVTNAGPAAGGSDVEDDPHFRARIRDFFSSLRRGTLGAIEFGARQVAGVAVARAIEVDNPNGDPAGRVELIISDANGNASGTMIQQVKDAELSWRAGGIPVDVLGGQVVFVPVTWRLAVDSGFDQQRVLSQVSAVTVAVAQFLRPGDVLYRATLFAAAKTVPGVVVSANSLVSPAADTVPVTNSTILRVQATGVTFV